MEKQFFVLLTEANWPVSVCSEFIYVLVVPVPSSSEVQRFSNCLPHLTAIKVEWVSVGVRWQLPTSTAHSTTLDQLPALLRHAAWFKVVLDGAGQVTAGEGAIVTCWSERKQRGRDKYLVILTFFYITLHTEPFSAWQFNWLQKKAVCL